MKNHTIELKTERKPVEPSSEAKAALEKADAQELYVHYIAALNDVDKIGQALETVAAHYIGNNLGQGPRLASADAIQAMERVALAAINLAKAVTDAKHP